jgi:hypothetical protein
MVTPAPVILLPGAGISGGLSLCDADGNRLVQILVGAIGNERAIGGAVGGDLKFVLFAVPIADFNRQSGKAKQRGQKQAEDDGNRAAFIAQKRLY